MRVLSVPELGSLETKLIWPDFEAQWPTAGPGITDEFTPMEAMGHPGDQYADPADLGRDRHVGALGPAQEQPRRS